MSHLEVIMTVKNHTARKTNESHKKKNQAGTSTMRTALIVHYDCGFPNCLYLRGTGCSSLSWESGTPLHNVKADEWIWETDETFDVMTFKILINDQIYELGENHQLPCGDTFEYDPHFG